MEKRVNVAAEIMSLGGGYFGWLNGDNFEYRICPAYRHRKSLLRAMRRHAERMGFDVDWSKCNG